MFLFIVYFFFFNLQTLAECEGKIGVSDTSPVLRKVCGSEFSVILCVLKNNFKTALKVCSFAKLLYYDKVSPFKERLAER